MKNKLVEGEVYFLVTFHDEDLLVPDIKTYIFIGTDCLESLERSNYFQSADEYFGRGKWRVGLDALEHGVLCMSDDLLTEVFDYEGLCHQLKLIMKGGASYYEG